MPTKVWGAKPKNINDIMHYESSVMGCDKTFPSSSPILLLESNHVLGMKRLQDVQF